MAFKEDIPLHVMPKLSIQSFLEKLTLLIVSKSIPLFTLPCPSLNLLNLPNCSTRVLLCTMN